MGNTSITGVLKDGGGNAWPGLNIDAYDNDSLGYRDSLGSAITDGSGRFRVTYPEARYGPIEKQPDLQIEVWSANRTVFLYKTREFPDATLAEVDVGTIQLGASENTSLTGRVVDENGVGIDGLVVAAFDVDDEPITSLGRSTTDHQGRYGLAYSPTIYGWKKDPRPDLMVKVLDRAGIRQLHETPTFFDVAVPSLTIADIHVQRAVAEGWAATLGGASASRMAANGQVEMLVDSEVLYQKLVTSIKGAKNAIWILQLAFEDRCVATYASPPPTSQAAGVPTDELAEAIWNAHSGASQPQVKILLNETIFKNTVGPLREFFAHKGAAPNRVTVRGVNIFPFIQHAKIAIIDGLEAYVMGVPQENEYWDTPSHRVDEPRRPVGALKGRPAHSVSMRISGKTVDDLEDLFIEMWNFRDDADFGGHDHLSPHRLFGAGSGGQGAQVVRTVPVGYLPGASSGETGILEGYQRAIAEARRFIYLEHQYFSARPIVEALTRALASNPFLEVIMLINENPDIPTYKMWQNLRLLQMGNGVQPRLGVFTPWSTAPPSGGPGVPSINQIYVESKVAIIDDKWATVGTANLDGVSQQSFDWTFPGRDRRNFEINVSLFDGVAGESHTGNVMKLRQELWGEHLGVAASSLAAPPGADGWLPRWRAAAAANVATLNAASPAMVGHVLGYSRLLEAKDQLTDLGITAVPGRLRVLF